MRPGIKKVRRKGREYYFRPCKEGKDSCLHCAFYDVHTGCQGTVRDNKDCHQTPGVWRPVVYRCPECDSTEILVNELEFNINTRRPHRDTLNMRYAFCNNCGNHITPKKCEK